MPGSADTCYSRLPFVDCCPSRRLFQHGIDAADFSKITVANVGVPCSAKSRGTQKVARASARVKPSGKKPSQWPCSVPSIFIEFCRSLGQIGRIARDSGDYEAVIDQNRNLLLGFERRELGASTARRRAKSMDVVVEAHFPRGDRDLRPFGVASV